MRLLFAEDEISMSEAVVDILTYNNYQVDAVCNGEDALAYAQVQRYDGIILDIMMPGMDGFEVLRRLRSEGCRTPVLFLTAKAEIEDRIRGLDLGADDYLTKPFHMSELLARVRAMLRRRDNYIPDVLSGGDLTLSPGDFTLTCGEKSVALPKLEYQLMEILMQNQGMFVPAEELLARVWGYDTDVELGSVWVYISYLRKRLVLLESRMKIHSKRSVGYKLELET